MTAGAFEPPTVRRAGPADAGTVRAITRSAYAKWVPLIGREPLPMAADYEAAVLHHRVDLALVAGEPVGLVETVQRDDDLLIENLAVLPARQTCGLGRHLLAHVEAIAIATDRPTVRLYTNALFRANIDFYARRGFSVEREEAFMGGTVVHMRKSLRP